MGRKSSVARLPREVREELHRILREGAYTIDEIVAHLRQLGADVSRSAVHRYRQRFDAVAEKMRQAQEIAAVWVRQLGEAPEGDVGQLCAQLLKTISAQTLMQMQLDETEEGADAKEIMMLARAIKDLEQSTKLAMEREMRAREAARREAAKAVEKVAREEGLQSETIDAFRRAILGVA